MDTPASIQAFLDSLSQVPGSMLYRGPISWQALLPGVSGQVLTIDDDGNLAWGTAQGYPPVPTQYGTGHYRNQKTLSSQGQTTFTAFKFSQYTALQVLWRIAHNTGQSRLSIEINASNHATLPNRLNVMHYTPAGTLIFNARTAAPLVSGTWYTLAHAFDAATGNYSLRLNDNAGAFTILTATTGALGSNFANISVGAIYGGAYGHKGKISQHGYKTTYLTDFSLFPDDPQNLWFIDPTTWDAWNGQPEYWNPYGNLSLNQGSATALTKYGTPYYLPD